MIYTNGHISLNRLKEYIKSKDYKVFVEDRTNEPEDWDWKSKGFWRGPLIEITSFEQIIPYLDNDKYCICYDLNESYYKYNAHEGEEILYTKSFYWELNKGTNRHYKIVESKGLGENAKIHLDLIKVEEDSCFVIGYWTPDKDNDFEFNSVGSRFFEEIDEEDIETVYKAMKKADKYLNGFESGVEND